MGGGLMQLVAYGAQDIYLTGNPQITFFKVVYRRHTNFSMECIRQTIMGDSTIRVDSDGRGTVVIDRSGDLVSNVYACFTRGSVANTGLDLCDRLVKNVDIEIGGQLIDRQPLEWMQIWRELTIPNGRSDEFQEMTGLFGNSLASAHNSEGTDNLVQIPLHFWFCRNPGLALPLIALQYHEVRLSFTWGSSLDARHDKTTTDTPHCEVWVDYIYLDTDERRRFAQVSHEYLIDQVQFNIGKTSDKLSLTFNHPVKELMWLTHPKTYDSVKTTVQLNGIDRFSPQFPEYFRYRQPFDHHSRVQEQLTGGGEKQLSLPISPQNAPTPDPGISSQYLRSVPFQDNLEDTKQLIEDMNGFCFYYQQNPYRHEQTLTELAPYTTGGPGTGEFTGNTFPGGAIHDAVEGFALSISVLTPGSGYTRSPLHTPHVLIGEYTVTESDGSTSSPGHGIAFIFHVDTTGAVTDVHILNDSHGQPKGGQGFSVGDIIHVPGSGVSSQPSSASGFTVQVDSVAEALHPLPDAHSSQHTMSLIGSGQINHSNMPDILDQVRTTAPTPSVPIIPHPRPVPRMTDSEKSDMGNYGIILPENMVKNMNIMPYDVISLDIYRTNRSPMRVEPIPGTTVQEINVAQVVDAQGYPQTINTHTGSFPKTKVQTIIVQVRPLLCEQTQRRHISGGSVVTQSRLPTIQVADETAPHPATTGLFYEGEGVPTTSSISSMGGTAVGTKTLYGPIDDSGLLDAAHYGLTEPDDAKVGVIPFMNVGGSTFASRSNGVSTIVGEHPCYSKEYWPTLGMSDLYVEDSITFPDENRGYLPPGGHTSSMPIPDPGNGSDGVGTGGTTTDKPILRRTIIKLSPQTLASINPFSKGVSPDNPGNGYLGANQEVQDNVLSGQSDNYMLTVTNLTNLKSRVSDSVTPVAVGSGVITVLQENVGLTSVDFPDAVGIPNGNNRVVNFSDYYYDTNAGTSYVGRNVPINQYRVGLHQPASGRGGRGCGSRAENLGFLTLLDFHSLFVNHTLPTGYLGRISPILIPRSIYSHSSDTAHSLHYGIDVGKGLIQVKTSGDLGNHGSHTSCRLSTTHLSNDTIEFSSRTEALLCRTGDRLLIETVHASHGAATHVIGQPNPTAVTPLGSINNNHNLSPPDRGIDVLHYTVTGVDYLNNKVILDGSVIASPTDHYIRVFNKNTTAGNSGGTSLSTSVGADAGGDAMSSLDKIINVYSFALKPEEHQPSGTCNFSRIDNATLKFDQTVNLKSVYAVNYNVLRIMSGMGGLAYSN
jgi:hypothetical protein